MKDHVDVMCQVRESFAGLHMDTPVENVFARSRARRRRHLAGMTAAAVGTAGTAAAIALTPGGSAPAHSGYAPRPTTSATLAAFSVTSGPGGATTLILHKGGQYAPLDPSALRQVLAQHGIPALVTVGIFCRPAKGPLADGFGQFVHPSTLPDGSAEMVINGAAMPSGTRLSIGYFPGHIRMAVIGTAAALLCSSAAGQPAAHISPSGTTIHEGQTP